jgi:hypothetical protein
MEASLNIMLACAQLVIVDVCGGCETPGLARKTDAFKLNGLNILSQRFDW